MTEATIRLAQPQDADALSAVGWATYLDTFVNGFRIPYSTSDLQTFFAAAYAPERFAASIADSRRRTWIAERGGEAVGFAQAGPANPADLPHPDVRLGDGHLQRLYLTAPERGTGLAARLSNERIGWLERDGPRTLWTTVWTGNQRSLRFCARFGFKVVGECDFRVGETVDRDFILRRPAEGVVA